MKSHDSAGTDHFYCDLQEAYTHAIALLARQDVKLVQDKIHLDIGCGFGDIAEKIRSTLNLTYVGVVGSEDGVESLASRGFEVHKVSFESRNFTLKELKAIVGDRRVASITLLNTLQHMSCGDEVLQTIADVARQHLALVVASALNVASRDIGAKLVLGRWKFTNDGVLDRSRFRLFDHNLLMATLEKTGLKVLDRFDVHENKTDEHFRVDHPALTSGSALNELLFTIAEQANPYATVSQFVWLCKPGQELNRVTDDDEERSRDRPFISAIVRTQGRRLHTLVELLTCFCGQTDVDFEVIVVGHRLDATDRAGVKAVISDTPEWLRARIRFLEAGDGGRAHPLNVGFLNSYGRYIGIIDDDDIPLSNWVATFQELDDRSPGRVLRSVAVQQEVTNVHVGARAGLRATGPLQRIYPPEFNLFSQLVTNASPNTTIAFPRGAFHDLGIRFDETLDTTEDWDFLMRTVAVCGVASSPSITGVYRWWNQEESSRTLHSQAEWQENYEKISNKLDSTPFILPKNEVAKLRKLLLSVAAGEASATTLLGGNVSPPGHSPVRENSLLFGERLAPILNVDLAKTLRSGVRVRIFLTKLKYWLWIGSQKRRRRYRSQIWRLRQLAGRVQKTLLLH